MARPWNPRARRGDLDQSVNAMLRLVSPFVGIARSYQEIYSEADDAVVYRYYCEAAKLEPLVHEPYAPLHGGSAHYTRKEAIASAIGEVVERYCGVFVPPDDVVWASANELGSRAIDPAEFALFAPEQFTGDFPFVPFTPDTRVRWVPMVSLTDGSTKLAPLQLVYLVRGAAEGEALVAYALSTGLACGGTYEDALLSGLMELVERDSFMITWYNGLSLPLLDWSESAELSDVFKRHFNVPGVSLKVVNLTDILGVPTALAIASDADAELAGLGVGISSAPTIERAWRKAVLEAYQTRTWARRLRADEPNREFSEDHSDIGRFQDRVHFYSYARNAHLASFLGASEKVVKIADVAPLAGDCVGEYIGSTVDLLASKGVDTYAREVTTPDVKATGLHVVRALAPALCPLDMSHKARYLGGARLREGAVLAGLRERPLAVADFTKAPHPFP